MAEEKFHLVSSYAPTGDQPQAIAQLVEGVERGDRCQTLLGVTGSGKTRFYVKPNLMQCFPTSDYPTSFVVTDPKGTLVLETGQMFQRAGYRVKILNTNEVG